MIDGKFVCVELFSGNADITKRLNCINEHIVCYSFDWEPSYKPDFVKDLSEVTYKELCDMVGGEIDFIWASPDCTSYSIAANDRHRTKGGYPRSKYAWHSDRLNENLWANVLLPSRKPFIVENPRGHYRNRPFAQHCFRRTLLYSVYGMPYPKPTDFFFNDFSVSEFFNFMKDNFRCPMFSEKGTVLENVSHTFLDRCKMPSKLLDDLARYVEDLWRRSQLKLPISSQPRSLALG